MTISLPAVTRPRLEADSADNSTPEAEPRNEPAETASERP